MKLDAKIALRLQFLSNVIRKECRHLGMTDQRLFSTPFTVQRATQLDIDPELAERVVKHSSAKYRSRR